MPIRLLTRKKGDSEGVYAYYSQTENMPPTEVGPVRYVEESTDTEGRRHTGLFVNPHPEGVTHQLARGRWFQSGYGGGAESYVHLVTDRRGRTTRDEPAETRRVEKIRAEQKAAGKP